MTKTDHLKLNILERADDTTALPAVLNANAEALDAAVAADRAAIAAKADMADVLAALGSGGHNCRLVMGTYVGAGTSNQNNPNRLEFPFTPELVAIFYGGDKEKLPVILARPMTRIYVPYDTYYVTWNVTWSDNAVQWYYFGTNLPGEQRNLSGATYYYAALGRGA